MTFIDHKKVKYFFEIRYFSCFSGFSCFRFYDIPGIDACKKNTDPLASLQMAAPLNIFKIEKNADFCKVKPFTGWKMS